MSDLTSRAAPAPSVAWPSADWLATGGRVLLATIFVLSGVSKMSDPAGNIAYIESVGLPFPAFALAAAIVLELIGGIMLAVGYRTRLVAAALALFSLATAVLFHANIGDQAQFINFFKNIAMAGGLLQVVAFGAGRWSIDRR